MKKKLEVKLEWDEKLHESVSHRLSVLCNYIFSELEWDGKLHESVNHRFSVLCNYILSVLEREHDIDDELVIVNIIAYINEQEKRTRSLHKMAEKMITDIAEEGLIEESQALRDIFENIFLTERSMYEILRGKAYRCKSKKDLSLLITNIHKIMKKMTDQIKEIKE